MIATISPGISCCENTLNTLHYADRVKQLSSKNTNVQTNNSKEENKIDFDLVENEILTNDTNKFDFNQVKDFLIDSHVVSINVFLLILIFF